MKLTTVFLFIVIMVSTIFAQNNSLDFDGIDDYVSASLSTGSSSSTVTMEFWVSFNTLQSGTKFLTHLYSGDRRRILPFKDASNNLCVFIAPQLSSEEGAFTITTSYTVNQNTWYHLAVVINDLTSYLYINGELLGSNTSSYSYALTGSDILYLATDYWFGSTNYSDIKLDEVRIWNDARTQIEIRQNMYRELLNPAGESNLLAYYKFDETSGTTANDSKGSNNGALSNMVGNEWQTSSAIFGPKNCLEFDGTDDWISTTVTMPSTYTKEAWVYIPSLNGKDNNIVSGGPSDGQHAFWISQGYNYQLSAGHNGVWNAVQDPDQIPFASWQHIAVTFASGTMTLYRNGVQVDQATGVADFTGGTAVRIGSFGINSNNLGGKLDEVRIWNDVRTEAEIREYMCKSLTGNEDNLVAYYTFDNSTGTSLPDISGNNNDGTLNNMDGSTDWVASSAFNTWLNTASSSWASASNWSLQSTPGSSDNVGIYNYSGGTAPSLSGSPTVNNFVLGASSSMTLSSALTVNGSLILENDVDLNGQTITLGSSAYLIEDGGNFSGTLGSITTTRNLSNIDENVAGLGAEITTFANMGSTTITRSHAANSDPASIERRYNIAPTTNTGLNATLIFHYDDNELNGLTESYLQLFRSTDGGTSWDDRDGNVNTSTNILILSGIDAFSEWTAMAVTPPVVNTQDPIQDYISASTAITVASALTVTAEETIEHATVSITPVVAEDSLFVNSLPAGLSFIWNNSAKILQITGSGTASDYQTALRNVKFETTSLSGGNRTIDFILGDGVGLMIDGNQHFYEVISNGSSITWDDARAAALNSRFGGAPGYLATITSVEENDFIAEKVSENTWIGASDNDSQGVWKWMDGPEAGTQFWSGQSGGSAYGGNYENWAGGEPNNAYSASHSPVYEDYAHIYGSDNVNAGLWNDYWNDEASVTNYLVEYGGDGSTFTTIDDATVTVLVAPTLSTSAAANIAVFSADLGGNITDGGSATVTERGVVYSNTDTTPLIGETGVTKDTNGSGTGSFSKSISGLSSNTTYYVQAFAINSVDTSYGGVESFTTDASIRLQTKVILEGPYSASGDSMNTDLLNAALIPTTSPYAADARTVASIPENIVDWMLVELRVHPDSSATVSKSALLHQDGRIVADDGTTSYIELAAAAGDYYIAVKHRNHIAVCSASAHTLSASSSTLYDFSTATSQYYGGDAVLVDSSPSSVYAMYSGDTDGSGTVDADDRTATWNNKNNTAYHGSDCCLTGTVDADDRTATWNNRNKSTAVEQ